ncbi:hypothetical protein WMY93_031675 [Mugilogobius chulae]|uniref:C1q domain-containing protein n=1 Tax=Mugilogobius chulae TaxID=88201 RepID=A0AAW0MHH0_9GOBI
MTSSRVRGRGSVCGAVRSSSLAPVPVPVLVLVLVLVLEAAASPGESSEEQQQDLGLGLDPEEEQRLSHGLVSSEGSRLSWLIFRKKLGQENEKRSSSERRQSLKRSSKHGLPGPAGPPGPPGPQGPPDPQEPPTAGATAPPAGAEGNRSKLGRIQEREKRRERKRLMDVRGVLKMVEVVQSARGGIGGSGLTSGLRRPRSGGGGVSPLPRPPSGHSLVPESSGVVGVVASSESERASELHTVSVYVSARLVSGVRTVHGSSLRILPAHSFTAHGVWRPSPSPSPDHVRAAICVQSLCQTNLSVASVMGVASSGGSFSVLLTGTLHLQAGEYVSVFVDNGTGSSLTVLSHSVFSGLLRGV